MLILEQRCRLPSAVQPGTPENMETIPNKESEGLIDRATTTTHRRDRKRERQDGISRKERGTVYEMCGGVSFPKPPLSSPGAVFRNQKRRSENFYACAKGGRGLTIRFRREAASVAALLARQPAERQQMAYMSGKGSSSSSRQQALIAAVRKSSDHILEKTTAPTFSACLLSLCFCVAGSCVVARRTGMSLHTPKAWVFRCE